MTKDYLEKEKLIADFFLGYEAKPIVIQPEEFFLIEKNGIFDSEIILELQEKIESFLGNGCFVIINDESVNACAMEKDEVPIIALYAGTIKKVFCDASIMMLSDEFLVGLGNMEACYHNVSVDEHGLRSDEEDNSLLKVDISGDAVREAVGYMIASLAIQFIIYHEVGHHKLGHIKKLKEKYNLFYQEALHTENLQKPVEEIKQMELEADLYAADLVVKTIDFLMGQWGKCLNIDVGYSEMFQLLIPALIIVKENLPVETYSVKEIENSVYLPHIIRIALTVKVVTSKPHIKEALSNDILEMFLEDEEYRKHFEEENSIVVLDDFNQLTDMAFERFYALMIAGTEQIYTKIFWGSYSPEMFQLDIKAMNWFLYSYK